MEDLDPLENSTYLDVSMTTGGHTSTEGVSMDQSDVTMLGDDAIDSSARSFTGNSLRSSRRRVQKHSAVVLNSDRLRRVRDNQTPVDDSIQDISRGSNHESSLLEENVNSTILTQSMDINDHNQSDESLLVIPSSNAIPSSSSISKQEIELYSQSMGIVVLTEAMAVTRVVRWWKGLLARRLYNFTIHNKWSYQTSVKVFNILLGYRIRRLFRSAEVKKMISAQLDMQRVLLDLIQQYQPSDPSVPPVFWLPSIRQELVNNRKFSSADQNLAKSLVKELIVHLT